MHGLEPRRDLLCGGHHRRGKFQFMRTEVERMDVIGWMMLIRATRADAGMGDTANTTLPKHAGRTGKRKRRGIRMHTSATGM